MIASKRQGDFFMPIFLIRSRNESNTNENSHTHKKEQNWKRISNSNQLRWAQCEHLCVWIISLATAWDNQNETFIDVTWCAFADNKCNRCNYVIYNYSWVWVFWTGLNSSNDNFFFLFFKTHKRYPFNVWHKILNGK